MMQDLRSYHVELIFFTCAYLYNIRPKYGDMILHQTSWLPLAVLWAVSKRRFGHRNKPPVSSGRIVPTGQTFVLINLHIAYDIP